MKRLLSVREHVERYLFAPKSPLPLAVLRISVGAVLLAQAVFIAPEILDLYGASGLFQGELNRYLLMQKLPVYIDWLRLGDLVLSSGDQLIRAIFITYVAALSLLTLGLYSRFAATVAWLAHFCIKINQGFLSSYGVDTFALIFLFYFIVMPVSDTLSFDAVRKGRETKESEWAGFSLRILQLHLFIIYCSSGLSKAVGDQWQTGEVIWRALNMPQFSIFDMSWLHQVPWVAKGIAWGTLALEIGYPILLGVPRLRRWGALGILALHLGIAVSMGLWSFGFFMMALTGSCFLVPMERRKDAPESRQNDGRTWVGLPAKVKLSAGDGCALYDSPSGKYPSLHVVGPYKK